MIAVLPGSRCIRLIFVGWLGLAMLSCDEADPPGRFTIEFSFDGAPPQLDTQPLWAWGRVEQWVGDARTGPRRGESRVVPFNDETVLDFDEVIHGDDLVVIIQLNEANSREARALWYGVSERFHLHPGDDIVVDVSLKLRPPPQSLAGAARIQHTDMVDGALPSPLATLQIKPGFADRITVANDARFELAPETREVTDLGAPDAEGFVTWPEPWNLNAGRCEGEGCVDGPRSVFVRLETELGLQSSLAPVTVLLDGTPPALQLSVNRARFNRADTLRIALSSDEPMQDIELRVEAPGGAPVELGEARRQGESFAWEVPAGALPGDGDYRVDAFATDRLGNGAWASELGAERPTLAVDITPPTLLRDPAIDVAVVGTGRALSLELELSEAIDPARSDLRLGNVPLTQVDGHWQHTTRGDEGSGLKRLQGVLVDLFGNSQPFSSEAAVSFDFEAPALAGPAFFARCDQRRDARVDDALDDLWLNQPSCSDSRPALTVDFTLDEAAEVTVTLDGGAALDVTREGDTLPARYQASFTPTGAEDTSAEGVAVVATATDSAGNIATLALGRLRFDFTAPEAPAVDALDALLYTRVPWGSDETGGVPTFTLSSPARGAAEAGSWLSVWEPGRSRELGRTRVAETGGFETIVLERADRPTVEVTAEDAAGNRSPRVAVRDIAWTATLGGKVAGDLASNPHQLLLGIGDPTPSSEALLDEAPIATGTALRDAATLRHAPGAGWTPLTPPAPPATTSHAAAFDEARGVSVLLLGDCGPGCPRTWEWDGSRWFAPPVRVQPSPRQAASMAWDANRQRVVLYGGVRLDGDGCEGSATRYCADTWTWDGRRWEALALPQSPPARAFAALTQDVDAPRLLLFGGLTHPADGEDDPNSCAADGEFLCNDTWVLDAEGWRQLSPPTSPSPRGGMDMAANPDGDGIVLFSGATSVVSVGFFAGADEATWRWRGGNWQEVPTSRQPSGRYWSRLVPDLDNNRLLLLGGARNGQPCRGNPDLFCADSWAWVDDDWQPLGDGLRFRRRSPVALWDGARREVLIHGGSGPVDECGVRALFLAECDLLLRVEETEITQLSSPGPSPRRDAAMAWDAAQGSLMLHGGRTQVFTSSEAWRWDSDGWRGVPQLAPQPENRSAHAMAYDGNVDRVMLVGATAGLRRELGTFHWSGSEWSFISDPFVLERHGPQLLWDADRERMLLFGGCDQQNGCSATQLRRETRQWDGNFWLPLHPTHPVQDPAEAPLLAEALSPPGRIRAAAGYDAARHQGMLHGGAPGAGTWLLRGARWTELALEGGPPPDAAAQMEFDPNRREMLLLSAADPGGTWIFDGGRWHRRTQNAGPATDGVALAYDTENGQVLAFGGADDAGRLRTGLWSYGAPSQRPVAVLRVDLRAPLVSGAEDPSPRILRDLRVELDAGASSGVSPRWLDVGGVADLPIPDNDAAIATIGVSEDCTIQDIAVDLAIAHPDASQLGLRVRSPAGTEVRLLTPGEAEAGRVDYAARFPAPTAPTESLDALHGESTQGVWTLQVDDDSPGPETQAHYTALLDNFALELRCADAAATPGLALQVFNPRTRSWAQLADTPAPAQSPAASAHAFALGDTDLSAWVSENQLDLMVTPTGDNGFGAGGTLEIDYWSVTLRYRREAP